MMPVKNITNYGGIFDLDKLNLQLKNLQDKTVETDFWNIPQTAQKILKKISIIENEIKMWSNFQDFYNDFEFYMDMINEGESIDSDALNSLQSFNKFLTKVETRNFLNEPDDHRGAILTIHPGAGGTESQDWASMLYRLYTRWCERNGFKIKIVEIEKIIKINNVTNNSILIFFF